MLRRHCAIARQLGIDDVVAEVLPEGEKSRRYGARRRMGRWRMASTMRQRWPGVRHVGLAIGTGTDVADGITGVGR